MADTGRRQWTARQAVAFLVDLARLDAASLSPGRWAVVLEDLQAYLRVQGGPTLADLRRAQTDRALLAAPLGHIRAVAEAIAGRTVSPEIPLGAGGFVRIDAHWVDDVRPGSPVALFRQGLGDALLAQALIDLTGPAARYIQACSRPACRRIFLGNRPRQRFCGRACASAIANVRWRRAQKATPRTSRSQRQPRKRKPRP